MNKVDLLVKDLLLEYPTLYHNRFEVLDDIFFNSCYEWDEQGCIAQLFPPKEKPTIEKMLSKFEEKVKESKAKLDDIVQRHGKDTIHDLYNQFYITDLHQLHDAQFIAANVDVFAKTYCSVNYPETWAWLFKHAKDGISTYGCIQHPPEVIDEEWREAIYDWTKQLIPSLNGLFGIYNDKTGWSPQEKYKEVFIWVYKTNRRFESPKEEQHRREFQKVISKILAEAEGHDNEEDDSVDSTQQPEK